MKVPPAVLALVCFLAPITTNAGQPQAEPVRVHVYADQPAGHAEPSWNYFGYDEPNYTYAPNGKKLLAELAALSPTPVHVRVHNLLTTGDGSASLKWGSTNVYTEDAAGQAVYSWTILDRVFDTFHDAGVKPLVEIGFMPEALSTHPEPYRHNFPKGSVFTGWAYPPKDYAKWAELVFQFVKHLRERYGDGETNTWLWEIWNEPDIEYWKGTPEEFFRLYDFAADATLRALPGARIGGPDSTGPASPKAAEFLRQFLEHCARGRNDATGATGSPLDFVSFHPKGSPKWLGDHVQMGISRQLASIEQGFQIVKSFPEWRHTPIVLGESDPEGCAACSAQNNPQNSYRNGPLYAAYTTEVTSIIEKMVAREQVRFLGAVNWSFEFEDQPYFAGFRELASNGLDKPVLNAFRMLGMVSGDRVKVTSSGGLPFEEVVAGGVRAKPDVQAIAGRREREVEIMIWNYHDDDVRADDAAIELVVDGLPDGAKKALREQFRIDGQHSNAFAAWNGMGSPQGPSASEHERLLAAGQLQLVDSPEWTGVERGAVRLRFSLSREGVSLVRIAW